MSGPALDLDALIALAEDYPYDRPSVGYLFDDGTVRPLEPPWHEHRTAVIACGSNGAPSRLIRKFAGAGARIPVTPAWLHDWVVVFSAHFASYGALPATLHPLPGARSRLCVTWLSEAQLALMHRSEGEGERYDYVLLTGLDLRIEGGDPVEHAGAYISRRGPLAETGRPVRLAEVATLSCDLEACSQRGMLRRVQRRLAPDDSYAAFMNRLVGSPDYRAAMTARLDRLAPARPV